MTAYYNENDPQAAAWLRELIAERLIPAGEVDERSVLDVHPADLAGFAACHFFAGIGGWAYALALAGWPDDRPIWTGSCPCQPFSQAGRGEGLADERHLWPAWFHLIEQCRPPVVFGEQVASKSALVDWFDGLVAPDLEGLGYAVAAADLPASSVGAPHIRQRLFWVADAGCGSVEHLGLVMGGEAPPLRREAREQRVRADAGYGGDAGRLADSLGAGLEVVSVEPARQEREAAERGGAPGRLADADRGQRHGIAGGEECERDRTPAGWIESHGEPECRGGHLRTDADHGGWGRADWLGCQDGRFRPVKSSVLGVDDGLPGGMVPGGAFVPASSPLAEKQERRVMRLRGYGNAIVPQLAAAFVRAFMECGR